jgi:hypothetical protein
MGSLRPGANSIPQGGQPASSANFPELLQAMSDPPLPDQVERFYTRLLERMKDLTDSSRRSIYLLLLISASVELLDQAAVSNVQIGPFQVHDLSFIQKALPVVGGFLIYELATNGVRYLYTRRLANSLIEQFQPALSAIGHYPRLVYPLASSLFGPLAWYQQDHARFRLIKVSTAVLRVGSLAIPPLLELRWYWRLFETHGFRDVLVWLSVCFTLGFVAFASLVVWTSVKTGMIRGGILLGPR